MNSVPGMGIGTIICSYFCYELLHFWPEQCEEQKEDSLSRSLHVCLPFTHRDKLYTFKK